MDFEIRHFHLFAGLGGGAAGFNRGEARVGSLRARFRCLGGIDVNAAAIADFGRISGVHGTVLDLFSREQYLDFHGREPPPGWREVTPDDIRRTAGNERPHIVFTSPPCKGLSGLLSEGKSKTDRYQALNRLTLRGIWLTMEAWVDDPPEFVILENVPRIQSRGRHLLDQIGDVLRSYGYAVAETTHDCGELGGLAQSRKRFLLVARHTGKISPFLYEPHKRPLRAVGDVLGRMPLPGDPVGGIMHRVPRLQWKTWVRLAFVRAGSDWRSLNDLVVEDGRLRDYLIVPEHRRDYLGVTAWEDSSSTVSARGLPTNGRYSVADPRFHVHEYGQYGVLPWHEHTGAICGQSKPGGGNYSVADPRPTGPIFGKYAVTPWCDSAGTVISGSTTAQGAFAVADPRPGLRREQGDSYLTAGHYGVVPWALPSGAVTASTGHDNGYGSVADPRLDALPAANEHLLAVIRALDGTWHRPFTTLELAALQGLVDPEEQLELDGLSDSDWRERIGNAVPPPAAQAIASVMGHALLLAWSGETFALGSTPIWVRPVAVAMSVAGASHA